MPTKKIIEICNYLGHEYTIDVIDFENVIYRKLNDFYDIEISGLNNNRKEFNAIIFVWDIHHGKHTIEVIRDISSKELLKQYLDKIIQKYEVLNI